MKKVLLPLLACLASFATAPQALACIPNIFHDACLATHPVLVTRVSEEDKQPRLHAKTYARLPVQPVGTQSGSAVTLAYPAPLNVRFGDNPSPLEVRFGNDKDGITLINIGTQAYTYAEFDAILVYGTNFYMGYYMDYLKRHGLEDTFGDEGDDDPKPLSDTDPGI